MTHWKLVPVEPTHNMILAGSLDSRMTPAMADSSYRAMLAAAPATDVQPVAWIKKDRSSVEVSIMSSEYMVNLGFEPLYTHPPAADVQPVAWTEREIELIDEMIEVQLIHSERLDSIPNRAMADKQKGWNMERVALLQKIKTAPPAADVQELVAALMIIAGKQRCVDSLMSNVDIAVEALKKWEGK